MVELFNDVNIYIMHILRPKSTDPAEFDKAGYGHLIQTIVPTVTKTTA